jgi:hypothetical protein
MNRRHRAISNSLVHPELGKVRKGKIAMGKATTGQSKEFSRIDLRQVFVRVQQQMLANLDASHVFSHPTSCGAATERHWIDFLNRYLPERYRATSAFIIDSTGRCSRQIDIAIYDRFYSPLLFHHTEEPYIPVESVYAVFEVKQTLTSKWIKDAAAKAASVRALVRKPFRLPSAPEKSLQPILAGILSHDSIWAGPFESRMRHQLLRLSPDQQLDLGCSLRQSSFELTNGELNFSPPEESLIYFILSLTHRLQLQGTAPPVDLSLYAPRQHNPFDPSTCNL